MLSAVLILLLSGCDDSPRPLVDPLPETAPPELPRPLSPDQMGEPGNPGAPMGAPEAPSELEAKLFWLQPLARGLEDALTDEEASALIQLDTQITLESFSLAKPLDENARSLLAGFKQEPPALDAALVDAIVRQESALRLRVVASIADAVDEMRPELRQALASASGQSRPLLIDAGAMLVVPHSINMRQLIHDSGAERVRPMLALIQEDSTRSEALSEALNAYEKKVVAIDLAGEAPGAAFLAAYTELDAVLQDSLRTRLRLGHGLLELVPEDRRVFLMTDMGFASYTAMMMEGATWGERFSLTTQSVTPPGTPPEDRPEMPDDEDPPLELLEDEAAP